MAIATAQGTKIYIGPVSATTPATASAYAALSYSELKNLESVSPVGDSSGAITFADMAQQRIRKFKGARDAGQVTITCAHDPLDAGQLAAVAAQLSNFNYAFKLTVADNADANDTPSVFYWLGKVMQARLHPGDANSVLKREYIIDIDTAITETAGVAVP